MKITSRAATSDLKILHSKQHLLNRGKIQTIALKLTVRDLRTLDTVVRNVKFTQVRQTLLLGVLAT